MGNHTHCLRSRRIPPRCGLLPLPAARREVVKGVLDSSRHRSPPHSQSTALDSTHGTHFGRSVHLKDAADALTIHGVASRYPDDWREVGEEEMNQMVELTRQFRGILLPKLESQLMI